MSGFIYGSATGCMHVYYIIVYMKISCKYDLEISSTLNSNNTIKFCQECVKNKTGIRSFKIVFFSCFLSILMTIM